MLRRCSNEKPLPSRLHVREKTQQFDCWCDRGDGADGEFVSVHAGSSSWSGHVTGGNGHQRYCKEDWRRPGCLKVNQQAKGDDVAGCGAAVPVGGRTAGSYKLSWRCCQARLRLLAFPVRDSSFLVRRQEDSSASAAPDGKMNHP